MTISTPTRKRFSIKIDEQWYNVSREEGVPTGGFSSDPCLVTVDVKCRLINYTPDVFNPICGYLSATRDRRTRLELQSGTTFVESASSHFGAGYTKLWSAFTQTDTGKEWRMKELEKGTAELETKLDNLFAEIKKRFPDLSELPF